MLSEQILDYKPILAMCYAKDPMLIEKWHQVSGTGLQSCIEKEFHDLTKANVKFYQVTAGNELIGYFCKENFAGSEFLTGFFLMPEFRKLKSEFWTFVNSHFDRPFFCGLFEKNLPANRFVKSQGAFPILKSKLPDGMAVLYKVG